MIYKQIKLFTGKAPALIESDVNEFLKQCQVDARQVLDVRVVQSNDKSVYVGAALSVMVTYQKIMS